MAVDLGVFERQKTIVDQQQLQDAFDLRKALALSQIARMQGGGNLPAPMQLANEYRRLRSIGDNEGANNLEKFAKTVDRGLFIDENGVYREAPNYGAAVGGIEAQKSGMQQQAKSNVDLQMNPLIKGREAGAAENAKLQEQLRTLPELQRRTAEAEASAKKGIKDREDLKSLRSIQDNLDQYSAAAKGTVFTGPVLGRIGDIAQAPGRTNLKSVANELTLRAKELLNFPNANFSNSDREFIQDVAGGSYAQYGGIEKVIQRLRATSQKQIDNILQGSQPQQQFQQQAGEPPLSQQRRLRFNLQTGELE
jgi:hypothetical protein